MCVYCDYDLRWCAVPFAAALRVTGLSLFDDDDDDEPCPVITTAAKNHGHMPKLKLQSRTCSLQDYEDK